MTRSQRILFKGEPAVRLENGRIRAVVLPNRGAKIASLVSLSRRGRALLETESLAQCLRDRYERPARYGMTFGGEDGTGFDDLCPCIAPCTLGPYPWDGMQLPDHGEVWALPWETTVHAGEVICAVHGIRLPYSLCKTIRLLDNTLRVRYRAENHAPFAMPFQWAAHAILDVAPGSRLIVPPGQDRIVNAYAGNRLPEVGREYAFPRPGPSSDFDLRVIPEPNSNGAQKYWFAAPVTEGVCGLSNPVTGLTTTIRFDRHALPFLGIWVNEGGWNRYYNVGIEPSTCILDDPVASSMRGVEAVLGPRASAQWQISIELQESTASTRPARESSRR
jgi:galactose mutarotase-like enzyme